MSTKKVPLHPSRSFGYHAVTIALVVVPTIFFAARALLSFVITVPSESRKTRSSMMQQQKKPEGARRVSFPVDLADAIRIRSSSIKNRSRRGSSTFHEHLSTHVWSFQAASGDLSLQNQDEFAHYVCDSRVSPKAPTTLCFPITPPTPRRR